MSKINQENIKNSNYMSLSIKDMNGKNYHIIVDSNTTVNSLKRIVLNQINSPNENQILFFDGKKFNENNTLNDCNINSDTKIHIVSRVSSFF
jgi:hypothetical protein